MRLTHAAALVLGITLAGPLYADSNGQLTKAEKQKFCEKLANIAFTVVSKRDAGEDAEALAASIGANALSDAVDGKIHEPLASKIPAAALGAVSFSGTPQEVGDFTYYECL